MCVQPPSQPKNLELACRLQIKNVAAASNAALQRDVASLQTETQEMQDRLQRNLQSFDLVQQGAQAVEGEVVDEARLFTSALGKLHVWNADGVCWVF